MGIATLASRVLGLVREQAFAYFFGAGAAVDAFNIAFRIPNLLRDLFAEGAMSTALVPTFIRARQEEGDARGWQVARRVFVTLFLVASAVALLGMFFAEGLVDLYASAYREVPGKFELTVFLTQVMFPFFPLVALAAGFMGVLNALGVFFLPAFASALFNAASVATGVGLSFVAPRYGYDPISGMAAGVVIGGLVQAFCQWPALRKRGVNAPVPATRVPYRKDEALKSMLRLMIPGTLGLAATQISILVNSILATGLGTGAVSWLNYAFRLMQFPIGVFGVSLAQATLPQTSRAWVVKDFGGFCSIVERSLKNAFAVNLPAAAGLGFLSIPIIQTIFQHGRFSEADTLATAQALSAYSIGLAAYSSSKVLVPTFYAMGNTRVPVASSLGSVALSIVLSVALSRPLGFLGLALATSITALMNAAFLLFALKRALRATTGFIWKVNGVFKAFSLYFLVSSVMGGACFASWRGLQEALRTIGWNPHSLPIQVLILGILVFEGIFLVLMLAQILKLEETRFVLDGLKRRLLKRR